MPGTTQLIVFWVVAPYWIIISFCRLEATYCLLFTVTELGVIAQKTILK